MDSLVLIRKLDKDSYLYSYENSAGFDWSVKIEKTKRYVHSEDINWVVSVLSKKLEWKQVLVLDKIVSLPEVKDTVCKLLDTMS